MAKTYTVAVLVGSLRANSNSGRLANAMAALDPPGLTFKEVPIGNLPLYNEDNDGDDAPSSYAPFRAAIRESDGVLFVTPEYNRSMPGGLKNAIDVASRPYGKGAILGKPAAIISSSPGGIGGFGANHALRQSLVFLGMPVVQQPEAYFGHVTDAFDASGNLTSDHLKASLRKMADALHHLIESSRM